MEKRIKIWEHTARQPEFVYLGTPPSEHYSPKVFLLWFFAHSNSLTAKLACYFELLAELVVVVPL